MSTTVEDAGDGTVLVTFRLQHSVDGTRAALVGEFNGWSTSATPMERTDDGFACQVRLEPGRAYRFRYLVDGDRWENDWHADAYVHNDFGGQDSVLDLTGRTALAELAPEPIEPGARPGSAAPPPPAGG